MEFKEFKGLNVWDLEVGPFFATFWFLDLGSPFLGFLAISSTAKIRDFPGLFCLSQGVANQTSSANGSLEIAEAAFPILEAHPLLPPNVSIQMEAGTSPSVI